MEVSEQTVNEKSVTYGMRVKSEIATQLQELSKRYQNKNDFANAIVNALNADDSEKDEVIRVLKSRVIELTENRQESELNDILQDNVIVPVTPFQRMCLDYLLERERKNLGVGNSLNYGIIYNYILDVILIEGKKWSIKSIPDSKINEFKDKLSIAE